MLEVVGGYKRKYACSIRNQEMKAPCCYGNTPAVVEYQCCFNDIGTIGFKGMEAGVRGWFGGESSDVCVCVCV